MVIIIPRIGEWKKKEENTPKYPFWENKESGGCIFITHETDWESPWLAELYDDKKKFYGDWISEGIGDVITYADTKSQLMNIVYGWMKKNPKGQKSKKDLMRMV